MLLYRLFFPALFLLGLPFYLMRMIRRGGVESMLKGRFGWVSKVEKAAGKKRIWVQAVSVGELLAVETLLVRLLQQEGVEVVLSTTTSTGFALARQKYGDRVAALIPFPLDFWMSMHMAWNRVQPDLCIMTEAELWPEHLEQARRREVPLILVNARLSDKSYRRMKRTPWLRPLFHGNIAEICAASSLDADRMLDLGFPADRLTVTGNLKFDVVDPDGINAERRGAYEREIWGNGESVFTVIGASTWPGEEALIIDAALEVCERSGRALRVLLVPRHAERRQEIRQDLETFGDRVRWRFRSRPDWCGAVARAGALNVYVADTTGELRELLQLGDMAVIGRSFPPHTEGQTPIEAIALGVPVIYGTILSNFRAVCRQLEDAQGAIRVREAADLAGVLRSLMDEPEQRRELAVRARQVFESGRGSTQRTVDCILKHF
jgi:3-deoxy-D-manno-octulosonic-acid transferase